VISSASIYSRKNGTNQGRKLWCWGRNECSECGSGEGNGLLCERTDALDRIDVILPTQVVFGGDNIHCLDVCCSEHHSLAICDLNGERICYSWGLRSMGMLGDGEGVDNQNCCRRPREIQFFRRLVDDFTVVKLAAGCDTSFCIFKKRAFHLNDVALQNDKLELLRELEID